MNYFNVMKYQSWIIKIFIILFLLIIVSVTVLADEKISLKDLIQVPSEESKALNDLQGFFEHPQICPLDKNIISFELRTDDGLKLYWYNIILDSLVELIPPDNDKGESGIFEEFGMTINKSISENYDLDWCPKISPYGEIICAYTHSINQNQEIYIYYLHENKHVLLSDNDNKYNDNNSRWSPDGSMIAFQSDRSGKNDIYLYTAMDKFLSFPKKYKPVLYSIPGNNEIVRSVISWNANLQSGILAFTVFMNLNNVEIFQSLAFISLPDSQSVWMMIDKGKDNMITPSWDPINGDKIAFYYSKDDEIGNDEKLKKYNLTIRNVNNNDHNKISINSISSVPINKAPVIIDDYSGPLWLNNSKYIIYLQKNNDIGVSLQYGDIAAWEKGESPCNGELLSSDSYSNIRYLSIEKQQITFVSEINDSTYIVIGNLTGEGAILPENSDYKLKRHPHYADFINQISQSPKDSFLKKYAFNPVGGKDFIINRPIVGVGIGALLIFLTGSSDDVQGSVNVWDDLPDPPNPEN